MAGKLTEIVKYLAVEIERNSHVPAYLPRIESDRELHQATKRYVDAGREVVEIIRKRVEK